MLATILTALFSSSSSHYHSVPNKPNHKRSKRNQVRLSFSMICCSSGSSSIAILSTASRIDGTVSRTRTRNSLPLLSHSFHFQVNVNGNHQLFIRRRISRWCRVSPNASSSLELPLLPFNTNEVLVPSESKTLHLYEARYLALLEESLLRKKLFVHFVLDPILISNSGTEASFAARYGCLVNIENIKRLDVGALVSIRGIGRVKLLNFVQSEPYLKGEVIPLQDRFIGANEISSKVIAVKDAIRSLNSLEIKLKAPKEELLQTCIANSLTWAEKEPSLECDQSFIPSPAERISFAAFQPITRSTQSETLKLQQQKLRAMDLKDTLQRLDNSLDLVNENISMVAAKLAIQSLEMQ
uniref:Lon N-terminal domain-containing protein n=1 Tax=Populus davidiana TaxID=266767 RepID=A0A6M2F1G6_9ROSI